MKTQNTELCVNKMQQKGDSRGLKGFWVKITNNTGKIHIKKEKNPLFFSYAKKWKSEDSDSRKDCVAKCDSPLMQRDVVVRTSFLSSGPDWYFATRTIRRNKCAHCWPLLNSRSVPAPVVLSAPRSLWRSSQWWLKVTAVQSQWIRTISAEFTPTCHGGSLQCPHMAVDCWCRTTLHCIRLYGCSLEAQIII